MVNTDTSSDSIISEYMKILKQNLKGFMVTSLMELWYKEGGKDTNYFLLLDKNNKSMEHI